MRILVLLVQYYPIRNPNVYRWSALAEHWVQQGHSVHVLCTRRAGEPNESVRNGVQVHRAGHATLLDWGYNVLRSRTRRGELRPAAQPAKPGWGRRLLEKIVDATWRTVYWPDGSCLWYLPGKKRALQLKKQHDFDAVISVSLPFTANLLALALKKKYPKLIWLMDIEDPFAISHEFWVNNFRLYARKNGRAEQVALQWADCISVTVPSAKLAYEHAYPAQRLRERIQVVPPVINPVQLEKVADFEGFITGKTHVAYFGTFYEKVRMPDAFLEIIAYFFQQFPEQHEYLQFHFFGEIPLKAWQSFEKYPSLRSNFRFHGLISREMVAAAMQKADFLLNVGNTTDYHLPSKSAEYLMSGKPIINICHHPNDTLAAFLRDYPLLCNLYAPENAAENARQLYRFLHSAKAKTVPADQLARFVQPYTVKAIANAYGSMLVNSSSSAVSCC